jgi:zinc protease
MHVLSSALTMMGGRLWRALRERPPFAYSVRAMPVPACYGGALVGYVTTPPGQEEIAVSTFVSEFARLSRDGLSQDELDRGRRYLAGMLEISMQRGATRAASYVFAEVAGMGYEHVDRLPDLVRGITNDDVVRVAGQYLTAEDGPASVILRG